ncbi:MAG: hypothetical protein P8177_08780 [Gemmatimonadota bacterium]|jgi:hypothetical protein
MSRSLAATALAIGAALAAAGTAGAQALTVELRAGAAIGNYSETEAGLETVPGLALAGQVEAAVSGSVAAYAAFTRATFGCEDGFCTGRDVTLTSQGLTAGVRWTPWWAWARAGLAYQWLDLEAGGEDPTHADPGLGFDLGVGLAFDLPGRVELRPGVTYRRHAANTEDGDGTAAVLAAEIGVAVGLGGS